MDYPQNLSKSDQHWYDLIQECRTSGKSDRQWLLENNIGSGTFYYHVKQLRKKACHIPENTSVCISEKQEVVPMFVNDLAIQEAPALVPESEPAPPKTETAIRLTVQGMTVEITNLATQSIIQNTVSALRYLC